MITNKALYDASVYTNLQGLESLHHEYKTNASGVKKEVSQQFESLLMQMLLKSMRDTNKEFSSGLMDSAQSSMYNDLYDKQLAMVLSKSGLGIGKSIEKYLDQNTPKQEGIEPLPTLIPRDRPLFNRDAEQNRITPSHNTPIALKSQDKMSEFLFNTASDFVKNLWEPAKAAAKVLGADPKILLAQAALETNWGKKIITHADGNSSKNLFNIKAGDKWAKEVVSFNTIEEKEGILVKEKSKFRAYATYGDSFLDYTHFLQNNGRYKDALKNAGNPKAFVEGLQEASYATDSQYSEKIMTIYSSKKFNALFEQNNLI